MAIIYSYPTVPPTADDLVLGTDVNGDGKPTKNFTIQSIVDIVQGGATGLGAVLAISADALQQPATNFSNIQGSGTSTFNSFTNGTMTITSGVGTGFTSITSTDFQGNLTGVIKNGSSIQGSVTGVTQTAGTSNETLATTKFVMDRVDPSVLTFLGTTGGDQTVNLITEKLSLVGTANEIESVSTAQTITFGFPAAGVVLPNGSTATTQATSDDSDKVATTKFVHDFSDAQDLDFTDGTSNGSVILGGPNAQTFSILGTTNQINTNAANQTLTISLPNSVTISGSYTGATFIGDLNGTINTATTGVTQPIGDDSIKIATTKYVDRAAGAKTLDYAGDSTGPFALNLSTDDLEFNGDSNITVTAAAVAATKGIVTIDLNNDVTITGTMQAGTFTDGTFTGSSGTYTGYTSITSAVFVGPLTGNVTGNVSGTAGSLASAGALSFGGEVTLSSSTPSPATYTSGGNISLNLGLNNAAVIGKVLTGLSVPATGNSIEPDDSILSAFGKLQAQHNTSVNGLRYIGTWDARTQAEGGAAGDEGNPALADGGGVITTGTNTSVVADQLVDSTKNFTTLGVAIGERVYNQAGAFTTVSAVGTTTLTLDEDIFLTNGQTYSVDNNPALNQGEYYVVNQAGTVDLNGNASWAVGDWVIAGAGNTWEKLDQTGVDGTGSINRIPRWDTVSSLNDSIILQDNAGIKIDTGKTLTTQGTGGSLSVGGSATISGLTTASAALSLTGGVNLPVGGYGAANQVLGNANAAGGAGNDLVWITPTIGTVESVDLTHYGDAFVVTVTDGSGPDVSIAIAAKSGAAATDYINGLGNITAFPTLDNYVDWKLQGDSGINQDITKQTIVDFAGGTYISTATTTDTLTITHAATSRTDTTSTDAPAFGATFEAVSSITTNGTGHITAVDVATVTIPSLPTLDNYQYWTLSDGTTTVNISSTNTAKVVGGTGITSAVSTTDKSVTLNFDGTFPAAHGTQYSLPLWTTATTLGDSQISQNSLATEITATQSFKVTGKHLSVGGGTTKGLTVGGGGPTKAGFNFGTSVPSTNQDFVAQQGIHYSGRLSANSTKKVMATVADSVADADFFGITARVYITSGYDGNASNTDVRTARIYDVACIPGQTPVFNKVIDQTTVGTLTVEFDAYTDGAATPKRGFTVNFTTDSGSNSQFYTTIEMLSARRASVIFAAS